MRSVGVLLAVLVVTVAPTKSDVIAQSVPLAFDAVSIKENKTASQDGSISGPTPGQFTVKNLPVASMMRYAYGVRVYQLIDLPIWASSTPYDLIATYPPGIRPTEEQLKRMLETLLADRFGLQVHRETRQLPAYELRVAREDGKLGPQLVISDIDCDKNPPQQDGPRGFPVCQGFQNRAVVAGRGRTLDVLAMSLQAMVRQKVLNRTGLTGNYNFNVRWPAGRGPAEEATVEEIGAMMTALEDQLGLKLLSIRTPDDVIVVDAIRRPTPN